MIIKILVILLSHVYVSLSKRNEDEKPKEVIPVQESYHQRYTPLRNILLQGSHWSYFDLCHFKKEILPPHLELLLEVLDSLGIFIYFVLMINEDEDGNISSSSSLLFFPLLWHSYPLRFMLSVIAIFSFLDFSASITCLSFPSSPFIPFLDSVSSTFLSKENHWFCVGAVFFFTPWLFLPFETHDSGGIRFRLLWLHSIHSLLSFFLVLWRKKETVSQQQEKDEDKKTYTPK